MIINGQDCDWLNTTGPTMQRMISWHNYRLHDAAADAEQTCRHAYRDDCKRQHDALQNVQQLVQLVQLMTGLKHNCYDKGGHDGHCSCHTGPLPRRHLEVQEPRHHKLPCTELTIHIACLQSVSAVQHDTGNHLVQFQLIKAKVSTMICDDL